MTDPDGGYSCVDSERVLAGRPPVRLTRRASAMAATIGLYGRGQQDLAHEENYSFLGRMSRTWGCHPRTPRGRMPDPPPWRRWGGPAGPPASMRLNVAGGEFNRTLMGVYTPFTNC